MPTPYQRIEPAEVVLAPRLVRPRAGRVISGTAVGLAQHLGLSVKWVRIALIVLTIFGGAGLAFYLFLWALTPAESDDVVGVPARLGRPTTVPATGVGAPLQTATPTPWVGTDEPEGDTTAETSGGALLAVGGLVVGAGVLIGLQNLGLNVRSGVFIPLLVIAAGAAVAWSQLDSAQRSRWLGLDRGARGAALARVAAGILLAVVGLLVLVTRGRSLSAVWDAGLATVAVLVGASLIAAPWVVRLWSALRAEQLAAVRATERADIAAHLHDSVLQTLALIQRKADDPTAVSQLARAQERELRSWLYAGPVGSEQTLAAALTAAAHEVEDTHGIPIDLVVTGDRPLEEHGQAMAAAFREALLNAVRHGRPPVSAFAEVGPLGAEAFVRDHGEGFDPDDVPEDRLGVRDSIVRRMTRHGGAARIRRLDNGTEVELTLPPIEGETP